MEWLISANGKMYDHEMAFKEFGYIDWRQNANYELGDIVYIYATKPIMKIKYKTVVEKINMSFEEITDDKKYWSKIEEYEKSISGKYVRLKLIENIESERLALYELKRNGLNAAPQGPIKVREQLSAYLESCFINHNSNTIFPEEMGEELLEGHRQTIMVNKYERSAVARQKCIEEHGLNCMVCDINFEEIYGEIGKGFIHVHHLVPLHEIGESYKVDYQKDLVPVCPNCHAMLHRKLNDKSVTIDELKKLMK